MHKLRILQLLVVTLSFAATAAWAQDDEQPAMGFFVTSTNIGNGADLGGIEGADAHCQSLAEAVGAGNRTWRAYMSTTAEDARDRIGDGPWYNVKGDLIATDIEDLHEGNDNDTVENSYTEMATKMPGIADPDPKHDMLTGSGADGRLTLEQEGVGGMVARATRPWWTPRGATSAGGMTARGMRRADTYRLEGPCVAILAHVPNL